MKLEEQEGRWMGIGGMGGNGQEMGDYDQNYMHV